MKARVSIYTPETPPDTAGLLGVYSRLIVMVKVLASVGDFSGVLDTALKLRRAAKALTTARARAAAIDRKWKMLLCPAWRERVISDLGGRHKLRLWDAAMKRAIVREHDHSRLWKPTPPEPLAQIDTPEKDAARMAETDRRDHIRKCARACANPQILKDPFRVDQDGLFRLPPVPRNMSGAGRSHASPQDYTYEPRRLTKLSGYAAPAMIWPAEIYAVERMEAQRAGRAPAFALGKTPGAKRRPARRFAGSRKKLRGRSRPVRRRIYAPP